MNYNRIYSIPNDYINAIKEAINKYNGSKKIKGYLTAKKLVQTKKVSYKNMKKIKNTFENANNETIALLGGKPFYDFINHKLNSERQVKKNKSKNKARAGMDNAYRKAHTKTPSAKPSFLNNSYKIFVNENFLSEFTPTKKIGVGSTAEVFQIGNYVIKRYTNFNSKEKERILKKIHIHKSLNDQNIIKLLDYKIDYNYIDVKYKKMKPFQDDMAKRLLKRFYYHHYYLNACVWDIDDVQKDLENYNNVLSKENFKQMMDIIRAHKKISFLLETHGIKCADAFFSKSNDNVMIGQDGTWKIIDF